MAKIKINYKLKLADTVYSTVYVEVEVLYSSWKNSIMWGQVQVIQQSHVKNKKKRKKQQHSSQ